MALLQNGSNFSAEPFIQMGLGEHIARARPWSNNGRILNPWFGAVPLSNLYGFPVGYGVGTAWILPIMDGGLYSGDSLIAGAGGVGSNSNIWEGVGINSNISGYGYVSATCSPIAILIANISDPSGTISTASLVKGGAILASLSGSGDMNPAANLTGLASLISNISDASGSISLASLTQGLGLSTNLSGGGNISTANIIGNALLVAAFTGSGSVLGANITSASSLIAMLSGAGDIIHADVTVISNLISILSGSGTISTANLSEIAIMLSNITGSGDVTASNLIGGINLLSSLSGNGNLSNTSLTGMAQLQCIINIGALPSSYDNAQAVMGSLVDGNYTVAQILKIIASVTAGKVSGGPNAPAFRDLTDATTVVTGTVDSNGNRTGVTLNP